VTIGHTSPFCDSFHQHAEIALRDHTFLVNRKVTWFKFKPILFITWLGSLWHRVAQSPHVGERESQKGDVVLLSLENSNRAQKKASLAISAIDAMTDK